MSVNPDDVRVLTTSFLFVTEPVAVLFNAVPATFPVVVSLVAISVGEVAVAVPLPTTVPAIPCVMYLFGSNAFPSAKSTAAPAPPS